MAAKQNKLILVGGGGHCKSCIDVIEKEGKYQIAGIIDLPENIGKGISGYPIIGADEDIEKLIKKYSHYVITLGQIKTVARRIELFEQIISLGGIFPVIISPAAIVSEHSALGEGTIVMHHAVVNAEVKIGRNCILNTKCLIEHDSVIGNYCHISTGAIINGGCVVGERCFIGSHATLAHNISVGDSCIVGAGSIVLRNLEEKGTYLGYPAVKVK